MRNALWATFFIRIIPNAVSRVFQENTATHRLIHVKAACISASSAPTTVHAKDAGLDFMQKEDVRKLLAALKFPFILTISASPAEQAFPTSSPMEHVSASLAFGWSLRLVQTWLDA